jgi:dTDP-glucose 4,6-dehydratase
MKNILVTGGLGFIGSNFIRMLLKSGEFDQVINFDKQTYAGNPENLLDQVDDKSYHFVHSDICDGDAVLQALEKYEIDAVVNFTAESHVDRSNDGPKPFLQTNVVGTLRLLEAFKTYHQSHNKDRQPSLRFLHISTDEVYG